MAGPIDRREGFTRLLLLGGYACDIGLSRDEVLELLTRAQPREFVLFVDAYGDPAAFRAEEVVGVQQFGRRQASVTLANEEGDDGEEWKRATT